MSYGIPASLEWWREREDGTKWLQQLPTLIDECVQQWNLELAPPFESTFGYVCLAQRPGERVALKISFPDEDANLEPLLLEHWGTDIAPAVLEHDATRCASLLEHLEPGWTTAMLDPAASLDAALTVFPHLWIAPPPDHRFPQLHDVCARWAPRYAELWEKWGRPFSRELLDEAIEIAFDLATPQDHTVLVHQDLHAGNILKHGTGWKVIDPKPLLGAREIDVARTVRDRPEDWPTDTSPELTLRRRIEHASERTGLAYESIRRCGVMHTLAWSMGDEGCSRDAMEVANWFARCK